MDVTPNTVSLQTTFKGETVDFEFPDVSKLNITHNGNAINRRLESITFEVVLPFASRTDYALKRYHASQMDPRKRIEMLEERKAEINKEIEAITDAEWSWRDDLGR